MEEQLGRDKIPQPKLDKRVSDRRCKICNLDEITRCEIEEDMLAGLGVTNIVNKYPEASLNASNVYSHRNHLTAVKAKRMYEGDLHKRHIRQDTILDSGESSDVEISVQTPKPQSSIVIRPTTGNSVLDDIRILDQIIAQGELLLEDVTIKDVLEAIRLKQTMLGNTPIEDKNKTEINVNQILAILGNDESKIIDVEYEES